jgi:hypothetical protein
VIEVYRKTALPVLVLCAAVAFAAGPSGTSYADNDKRDDIDPARVQQGFDASPIPKEKLNLKGKNPYLVGLGSYLVNSAADCNGCHTFPRFLRPGGGPGPAPETRLPTWPAWAATRNTAIRIWTRLSNRCMAS